MRGPSARSPRRWRRRAPSAPSASCRSSTSASAGREPFPTAVDLVRSANTLSIEWDDGARSTFAGAILRWACPCAECRGELGSQGRLDTVTDLAPDELVVTDVQLVGAYALGIAFKSGHSTGIYTFRYLRSLGTRPASS